MNPPPRTGISRESGSVMFRTGPGPFSAGGLPRLLRGPGLGPLQLGAWACLTGGSLVHRDGRAAAGPRLPGRPGLRIALLPVCDLGLLGGLGTFQPGLCRPAARRRRRATRPAPRPPPRPVRPGLRLPRRLRGFPLGFQPGQRRGGSAHRAAAAPAPPPAPHPRGGPRRTAHPRPRPPRRARPARCAASCPSVSSVRFAAFDAVAAIFIPSSATTPSLPMPSRAHSISTW